jgi:hypothetical protein
VTFFDELRQGGANWDQIAILLRKAGLRTKRGDMVSADVLRATFARESGSRRATHNDVVLHTIKSPRSAYRKIPAKIPAEIASDSPRPDRTNNIMNRMRRASSLRSNAAVGKREK